MLAPYTYYFNFQDEPVFLTHDTPLLGVRDGAFVGLETRIHPNVGPIATGTNADGTTIQADNCQGWSNTSGLGFAAGLAFANDEDAIRAGVTAGTCDYGAICFYCVEQ